MGLLKCFVLFLGCLPAVVFAASNTVTFSAIGCGPYSPADIEAIRFYLQQENKVKTSEFFVHLGDINSGADARSGKMTEPRYKEIRTLLSEGSSIPAYIVPGDNEWNDMPDPKQAWTWWSAHLQTLPEQWKTPWSLKRQEARSENFAFVHKRVLFIGINLPGGKVHDAAEWKDRFVDNNKWIGAQLAEHKTSVRAAVIFCQANMIGSGKIAQQVNLRFKPFREGFTPHAKAFDKQILFLHADGHKWLKDRPFEGAPNVLRVQVDRANPEFPPLQISVQSKAPMFTFDRRLEDAAWRPKAVLKK